MLLTTALWTVLRAVLCGSAAIALENLALRHQLAVLQRAVPRVAQQDHVRLGREIALDMAQHGASVVVNDLGGNADGTGSGKVADDVVKEIRAAGIEPALLGV